jgi:membrane-associated protease RseP (regulator of RpoE activity)
VQVFLNILIMLVILAVLISIHEAGHLSMAKLFKVYCFEYSIGFGPKLLHVKKKGGETYFSIRALPFGGYCSMYGEPGVVPDDVKEIPPASRSLEGVAKWKKIIILIAGVTLNYLLGLILLFISVSCFPQYYMSAGGAKISDSATSTSLAVYFNRIDYQKGTEVYSLVDAGKDSGREVSDYYLQLGAINYPSLSTRSNSGTILDSDVTIYDASKVAVPDKNDKTIAGTFVAVYTPTVLTSEHTLSSNLHLYWASSVDPASVSSLYAQAGITHFPDLANEYKITVGEGYTFQLDLAMEAPAVKASNTAASKITISPSFSVASSAIVDPGLNLQVNKSWNSWSGAWEEWAYYVPACNAAIFNGLVGLFNPANWSQLSGIVGMTAAVGTYSSMGGAAAIFLYAGLISINLAIFNLLPFPGLDGWQILVTCIEGAVNHAKRKKWERAREKRLAEPVAEGHNAAGESPSESAQAASTQPSVTKTEGLAQVSPEKTTTSKEESKVQDDPSVYKPWKINDKVKGIVSYVGLGLLLVLMVAIMIKDIIGLF